MAREWLERDDLSVFVVAGVPKGFNRRLSDFVKQEQGEDTASMRVNDDLSPWILSRVRGEYRTSRSRSPASRALWRAYRALAAARYHLRGDDKKHKKLKKLRDQVEMQWLDVSPLHREATAAD